MSAEFDLRRGVKQDLARLPRESKLTVLESEIQRREAAITNQAALRVLGSDRQILHAFKTGVKSAWTATNSTLGDVDQSSDTRLGITIDDLSESKIPELRRQLGVFIADYPAATEQIGRFARLPSNAAIPMQQRLLAQTRYS